MNIAKKVIVGNTLTFQWADETTTEVDLDSFQDHIDLYARNHGFSQKLGDSYSGAKSVAEAKAKLIDTLAALEAGDWNRKGGSTGGVWVEALARAAGKSIEEALAKWDSLDDDARKAIKAHPEVAKAKAAIDFERAKAKADAAPTVSLDF